MEGEREFRPPPGTVKPQRFRPRLHWELLVCGTEGHELIGNDVADVRPEDSLLAFETDGVRWHRCLRCDSWLPLPPPAQPARRTLPPREEIELPLRGKALRDKIVLRLIAIDRALHFFILGLLGIAILLFAANRNELRSEFYAVVGALQRGVGGGPVQTDSGGLTGELAKAFSLRSSTLHLVGAAVLAYGVLEGIEAVGLWFQKRWAEYLTLVATSVFLPLEVIEMVHHFTPFKLFAFILNVAVVIYLLYAKRLFGIRGGAAADAAERARDMGWQALERTAPFRVARAAVAQPK